MDTDTSDSTIEDRVRRLEDRFAIIDLEAEYCAGIDNRDLDRFLACFTSDALVRHHDGALELQGRDAIRAYYETRFRDYGVTFHYPHNHSIYLDGGMEARGVVTGHAEMSLNGESWIAALRYTDRYRIEEGRWRFAERVMAFWYYLRLVDLTSGLGEALRKHYRGELLPADLPEGLNTYRTWHERLG